MLGYSYIWVTLYHGCQYPISASSNFCKYASSRQNAQKGQVNGWFLQTVPVGVLKKSGVEAYKTRAAGLSAALPSG